MLPKSASSPEQSRPKSPVASTGNYEAENLRARVREQLEACAEKFGQEMAKSADNLLLVNRQLNERESILDDEFHNLTALRKSVQKDIERTVQQNQFIQAALEKARSLPDVPPVKILECHLGPHNQ